MNKEEQLIILEDQEHTAKILVEERMLELDLINKKRRKFQEPEIKTKLVKHLTKQERILIIKNQRKLDWSYSRIGRALGVCKQYAWELGRIGK